MYWKSGSVPLLDIQAEFDPYRPRETQNQLIEEFGPQRVTVVVVKGASHALPVENPKAAAEALVSFAKKLK